jgi:ectoine hydroxylase-related dioxygenase (phytanoyl-CoA dioxygenase family)
MPKALTEEQVACFDAQGYHAPVRVLSERDARRYREHLESFERRYPDDVIKLDQKAHMLCPWVDEMIRLPGLLDPLEDLLGPNLLCWGTSLRVKEPDGKTFAGWHQDTAYADVKPIVVICALALSPCRRESGCIRVIPGSHRWELLPHRENFGTASLLTREQTIEGDLDTSGAVDLLLEPGEAALFNNAICHSSEPNCSRDRRILFLIEIVPTYAHQAHPRESATLVRGVDEHHNFDIDRRPDVEMSEAAVAAWREKVEVQAQVLFRGAARPPRALAGKVRPAPPER